MLLNTGFGGAPPATVPAWTGRRSRPRSACACGTPARAGSAASTCQRSPRRCTNVGPRPSAASITTVPTGTLPRGRDERPIEAIDPGIRARRQDESSNAVAHCVRSGFGAHPMLGGLIHRFTETHSPQPHGAPAPSVRNASEHGSIEPLGTAPRTPRPSHPRNSRQHRPRRGDTERCLRHRRQEVRRPTSPRGRGRHPRPAGRETPRRQAQLHEARGRRPRAGRVVRIALGKECRSTPSCASSGPTGRSSARALRRGTCSSYDPRSSIRGCMQTGFQTWRP